jgi:alpha-galactosidase
MEYRMHMSLWAIAGHSSACRRHIPDMTDNTKNISLNKEAIAIDQDQAGHRGDRSMLPISSCDGEI